MACPATTPTGILVAYSPTDTGGGRPLPAGTVYWESPNIRLALGTVDPTLGVTPVDPGLLIPANWDPPNAPFSGQVAVNSAYILLVRIRNTDPGQARASLNLQGWVSNYTAGGVGPGSAIPGPAGPVSFTGFNGTDTLPPAKANPSDPTGMLVLKSGQLWTPTTDQLNGPTHGHVCVAVNVWADATTGGDGSPATPSDGESLTSSFLDPTCDRMYGQRNVQIVMAQIGQRVRFPIMVLVPATDRCPLDALVRIRRAELAEDQDGTLRHIHELDQAASAHAITRLCRPDGDPLGHVKIGHEGSSGGDHLRLHLEPGERADLTVTLDPAKEQKPGDTFAFDILTTDTATDHPYGAARVYVLVTA